MVICCGGQKSVLRRTNVSIQSKGKRPGDQLEFFSNLGEKSTKA